MFEVEKKFLLTEEIRERIIKSSEFIGERTFTDSYYDTVDYSLISKNMWLRERNGKFELKVSLNKGLVDQYDEIEDENKIRGILQLQNTGDLKQDLNAEGYTLYCTCKTIRSKYKKDSFTLDLDFVDYGDFTYTIGEIECMVTDKSEINDTVEKIIEFAKRENLEITPVRGKVLEYLKRKNPQHYSLFVKAGVVGDS